MCKEHRLSASRANCDSMQNWHPENAHNDCFKLTCITGDKANKTPCNDIWTEAEVPEGGYSEDEFDPRPAPE